MLSVNLEKNRIYPIQKERFFIKGQNIHSPKNILIQKRLLSLAHGALQRQREVLVGAILADPLG